MKKNNYNGALQYGISSGFGPASTATEVIKGIDLSGKIAIVTGGYAGIGLETVKILVSAGAHVIVPARNRDKALKNLSGIPNVDVEIMDLQDPQSIDKFANGFLASDKPLHLLINNAGIMWVPLERDSRGYESQLSTNYLGHFQLTARLWSALVKASGARVVNVSSWGHHFSPFIFEDPNFIDREFESFSAYGQSKTASILFSLELDIRGQNSGVRSYSLHPGIISESELGRNVPHEDLVAYGVFDENGIVINAPYKGLKSISQGASTTIWCATTPQLNQLGGVYCENADIAELDQEQTDQNMDGSSMMKGVAKYALDEVSCQKLWILSENLTGLKFSI
ncbi:SDR family NAD(P)-dependent oxidoreductase [Pedobacter aquatilis]|uniref:SDR family NAD(P)-dependent oxidoreductase n=1 Tax=Pedobacter aquatilis TaxID=351343 RepID=UPI00292F5435|nr:SDR family NAD(P)-dependent oxidoreductase [Pedobacter aquatilis]